MYFSFFSRTTMPKTTRHSNTNESMRMAFTAVNNGMPYLTAAKQFNLPRNMLKRRHKWAHDECAGIESDDDEFICDLCAEN